MPGTFFCFATIAAVWAYPPQPGSAQAEPVLLQPRTPIGRPFGRGEVHTYRLALRAGQFAVAMVEQQGIDVVVRVRDPGGVQLDEIDSPNGTSGPEPVLLFAGASGEYRLELRPFLSDPSPGRYRITLERVERAGPTPAARVDQLFSPWNRPGTPGAAVAVVRNGVIVLSRGYGFANIEHNVPVTPQTIFHGGSISKQFAGFAIATLVLEGRVALDADVRTYLPELHDFGPRVTVRHLLHHTSGLREELELLAMAGWRLDDVITQNLVLRLLARQRALNFPPGEEYLYSNTGYTLLAEIVRRVTGQSLSDWSEEHVFRPFGMRRTHFHDDHEMVVPGRASPYAPDPPRGGYRSPALNWELVGPGGLYTTAEDLAKWMIQLEHPRAEYQQVFELVATRGVLKRGDTLSYSFGQIFGSHRGLRWIALAGADPGYRSAAVLFPDQHIAVVVMNNLSSVRADNMAVLVAELYLANALGPVEQPAAAARAADQAPAPPVDWFRPTRQQLSDYAGEYYSDELWTTYTLTVSDSTLTATHLRLDPFELRPLRRDEFEGSGEIFTLVRFERDSIGAVVAMRVSNAGVRDLRFARSTH